MVKRTAKVGNNICKNGILDRTECNRQSNGRLLAETYNEKQKNSSAQEMRYEGLVQRGNRSGTVLDNVAVHRYLASLVCG